MALRALRDWRWLLPLVGGLALLAFLARRHLVEDGAAPVAAPGTEPVVAAADAASHVGRTATVCGRVAEAAYVPSVEGRPTFLNVGGPDPDQDFTAVIWGDSRARFDTPPERAYRGARLCVAGPVTEYEGVPQIEVRRPSQLRVGGRPALR